MAIFAEVTENECVNDRRPLVKGNILTFVSGNLCEVRYIKLLISENRTLTLMLHHFDKR